MANRSGCIKLFKDKKINIILKDSTDTKASKSEKIAIFKSLKNHYVCLCL